MCGRMAVCRRLWHHGKGIMNENIDTEICECKQREIDMMFLLADIEDPRGETWVAEGGEALVRNRRCDC